MGKSNQGTEIDYDGNIQATLDKKRPQLFLQLYPS